MLAQFLAKLSQDPKLQAQFRENPFDTMKDAGLSDDEILAVLSRKVDLINAAMGITPASKDATLQVDVVVVVLPPV